MVGQVVGAAVAPVVVQSATNQDGLINRLFKLAILIGVIGIIAVVVGIALFIFDTDLQSAIVETISAPAAVASGLVAGLLPFGVSQPFRVLQVGLTGLASGFAFRGK